jgi:RNA polymerase sigma-70 factor (ECF subfamily)
MKMPEECLLEAVARGDRCAFEDLYRCYYPRLTRFLARRLPPSHSADEIINDTLLIVWKHAREFRHQSQVSTWIFGIAHRVALKSLRRDRRSFVTFEEPFIDPYRQLEQEEWITQGLSRLPHNQRVSLLLVYQLGHSVEQVATMTECSAGTVKSRMFHARVKLRHFLTALQ